MVTRPFLRFDAGRAGAVACLAGVGLLFVPSLFACALGLELLSAAFWLWARAAADGREQLPRWEWLRRPAMAAWLAFAIDTVLPTITRNPMLLAAPRLAPIVWLEAAAVVWAGLELVAALPLARPYSDFAGPYEAMRPWIPVVLPSAGFLVLWSQSSHWTGVVGVRDAAVALLVITAFLSALRAFARRGWTASLRWLCVAQTALALLPLAQRTVHPQALFMLWLGAFGGPAIVLAGEMSGASLRRGRLNARLWRAAGWLSVSCVSWPALVAFAHGRGGVLWPVGYAASAVSAGIAAWIMVGRLEVAPERRRLLRPGTGMTSGRVAALIVLTLGPIGLAMAWWNGFEPAWLPSAMALTPVMLGGALAVAPRQKQLVHMGRRLQRPAALLRVAAAMSFRSSVRAEQAALGAVIGFARALGSPLRDLHTGDAQEYLLLLAGVSVLALVLPLLR
jgi:hypothetical protein